MAQHAHVPKFGNWDGDNIPYTTYFENARKDKGAGTKTFNPNDPEENPNAFMSGIFAPEHELRSDSSGDYGLVKRQHKKYDSREAGEFLQGYMEVPEPNNPYQIVNMELPARSKNRKNGNSGSGSNKSSSDTLVLRSPHRRRPSKHSTEGNFCIPPSPPRQSMLKSGKSPQRDALHDTPSSVPRFGAWDEKDPRSGEGFTIIFNKVKQEKQVAATKLPMPPTEPTIYPDKRRHRTTSSSRSKISCCLCPTASE